MSRISVFLALLIALASPTAVSARFLHGGATTPVNASACTNGTPVSIPVSTMAVGSFAANSIAGWTNPAGSVFQSTNWTSPSTNIKYIESNNYENFIATTAQTYCDAEVTTWSRNATVFMRINNGTAVYFLLNGESTSGTLDVGIVTNLSQGLVDYGINGTFWSLYNNTNLAGTVSGYNGSATAGATFTFGVVGTYIYVKFNGTQIFQIQDYRQPGSGTIALQANTGYGFRDVTVTPISGSYFSNLATKQLDLRDWGLKSVQTTGSMSAGSSTLTVANASGFTVGSPIIVAIGGEAGGGLRGTVGVGGTWPARSYASLTAMNADTSQPTNTFAWVRDSSGISGTPGDVYQWTGSSWVARASDTTTYYSNKALPKALVTTVTAVAGNTLTLAAPSTAATANAGVYYDNAPAFNAVLGPLVSQPGLNPSGYNVTFPVGTFAVGSELQMSGKTGWTFRGNTRDSSTILSPLGAPSAEIVAQNNTNIDMGNYAIQGNLGPQQYGLQWSPNDQEVTETSVVQGRAYPSGLLIVQDTAPFTVHDYKGTDVFQDVVGTSFTDGVQATNIQAFITKPIIVYLQWMYVFANSNGGTCINCSVNSAYLAGGMATFQSKNISYINPTAVNAVMESNSSGSTLYQNPTITIEPNDPANPTALPQYNEQSFSQFNPLINIDVNQGYPDSSYNSGGTVTGAVFLQKGYINANNDTLIGVNISSGNIAAPIQNITVNGVSYTAPDWKSPSTLCGPLGLNSDDTATFTTFENFTVTGVPNPGNGCANVIAAPGTNCTITNVTAPVIHDCTTGATINSVQLSSSTFTGGTSATVGSLTTTLSSGSFTGSYSLQATGTDHAGTACTSNANDFQISGANLITNGTQPAGSYPGVCVVATQSGLTNSPYVQAFTITGTSGYTGPCDVITGGCAEAYSVTRAMTANYNGPLFQLAQVNSPTTLLDIGQTSSHKADMSTWAAFCSNNGPTFCRISKIYAQIHTTVNDLAPQQYASTCTSAPTANCAAPFTVEAATGLPIAPVGSAAPLEAYSLAGDAAATGVIGGSVNNTVMMNGQTEASGSAGICGGTFGLSHVCTANNCVDTGNTMNAVGFFYGTTGANPCANGTSWCSEADYEGQGDVGPSFTTPSRNIILMNSVTPRTSDGTYATLGILNGVTQWNGRRLTGAPPGMVLGTRIRLGSGGDFCTPAPILFREGLIVNGAMSTTDEAAARANMTSFYSALTFQ